MAPQETGTTAATSPRNRTSPARIAPANSPKARARYAVCILARVDGRVPNLLGVLVLGLGDVLSANTEAQACLGNVDPAELVTVSQWPGETIDALSETVGLSLSATVR